MRYILFALSALLLVSACKKVEVPLSKQEILKESRWGVFSRSVEKRIKADGQQNMTDVNSIAPLPLQDCETDDIFVFRDNNLGGHITGEKRCSINETAEIQFSWGIYDDDTKMYIYDAKEFFKTDVNAELVEFLDDRFTIKFSEYDDKLVRINDKPAHWLRDTTIYTIQFIKK